MCGLQFSQFEQTPINHDKQIAVHFVEAQHQTHKLWGMVIAHIPKPHRGGDKELPTPTRIPLGSHFNQPVTGMNNNFPYSGSRGNYSSSCFLFACTVLCFYNYLLGWFFMMLYITLFCMLLLWFLSCAHHHTFLVLFSFFSLEIFSVFSFSPSLLFFLYYALFFLLIYWAHCFLHKFPVGSSFLALLLSYSTYYGPHIYF